MATKKKTDSPGAAGQKVELKDKATGFYDPQTGLKIVHDQQATLGGTVGRKTNRALLSGSLLIVGSAEAKDDEGDSDPTDDFDLPADLPGREAFIAAGFTNFASVKELHTDEMLLAVKGIGKGTIKNLVEWAKANAPKGEED